MPTISPVPSFALLLPAPLGFDVTDWVVALDGDDGAPVGDAVTKLDRNEVIGEKETGC